MSILPTPWGMSYGSLSVQDHSQSPHRSLCLTEHLCAFGLQVSHDILLQLSSSYMAADAYPHPLADLVCQGESKDLHSYFEQSVQNLLKESSEKFKGWLSTPGPLNTELSCKKVNLCGVTSPVARAGPTPSLTSQQMGLCRSVAAGAISEAVEGVPVGQSV